MSPPENSSTEISPRSIKVWDIPIRIFHWLLVLSFAGAFITNWLGVRYFKYHAWFGYSIIILVAFRMLWGFIGTYHARFWNFIPSPQKLKLYLQALGRKQEKPYTGHNPLGALMVIALLLGLAVQAITGLYSNDEISNVGPLYGYISNELSLKLTALHQELAYWILAAVVIHIGAVFVHVKYKQEPLVKAMFRGNKPYTATADTPVSITHSKLILAVLVIVILAGLLAWLILSAPEASVDFY